MLLLELIDPQPILGPLKSWENLLCYMTNVNYDNKLNGILKNNNAEYMFFHF